LHYTNKTVIHSQGLQHKITSRHTSYTTRGRFFITHVLACARVEMTLPHAQVDARTVTEGASPSYSTTTHHKLRKTFLYNTALFGREIWQPNSDGIYGHVMTV